MSNTVKVREWNGGRLTRPRAKWHGHARGMSMSPFAADMNQDAAGVMGAFLEAFGRQARNFAQSAQRLGNADRRSG